MKAKEFHSLEKLIEVAASVGHNKQEASKIIAKNYEYIKRAYPNVSAKKAVHIAYVIY